MSLTSYRDILERSALVRASLAEFTAVVFNWWLPTVEFCVRPFFYARRRISSGQILLISIAFGRLAVNKCRIVNVEWQAAGLDC